MSIRLVAESKALVKLHLLYPNGEPTAGIQLTSPKSYEGETITLDENGSADVYVVGSKDPIHFSIDYLDMTWTRDVVCLSGDVTVVSDVVTIHTSDMVTATKNITFSSNVESIRYQLGAGGNGGASKDAASGIAGSGGRGGGVTNEIDAAPEPYTAYTVTIGAGGAGGDAIDYYRTNATAYPGSSGGNSSFMSSHVASGGGGAGGAAGNQYKNGTDGGVPSTSAIYGGGGGGGCGVHYNYGGGSRPVASTTAGAGRASGGYGGSWGSLDANQMPLGYGGASGSYSGGGGGGAVCSYDNGSATWYSNGAGGKGGNGFLKIAMVLKKGVE